MRPALFAGALAGVALLTCRNGTHPSAHEGPLHELRPDPTFAPSPPSPLAGAAAPLTHPNDARDDVDLGARVASRPLSIPRLQPGQSTRFTFGGGHRAWALQLVEGATLTTPAYARGKVFVGAGFTSTTVYALDARTGALSWTGDTPDGGPSAAIVEDDKVLFNTESCTLFAFDVATGRARWSRWLGDPLMSQPTAADGRVFSAHPSDAGFSFTALSIRNGHTLWTRPVPADVITAAVASGEHVYFTTMDGAVFKLRARDGRTVWRRALDATSAPAVDGDHVYVARRAPHGHERQVTLSALDGRTVDETAPVTAPYARERADVGGTESGWSYEGARPTLADGRLYHAMGDEVVARDVANGRVVWRKRYPGNIARHGVTSPAVVGSQLVVGTRGGDVFGMDIDTGATTWAWNVGEPIAFQPAVANGWVYVATARGKVIGLEVADAALDGWHMWGGNARHDGLTAPSPLAPEPDLPGQGTLRAVGREGQAFPLLHTAIDAEVTGVIARVSVEQSFTNPHPRPVDAEYLFPLPANAAVDAMDLYVGARVIHAVIQPRGEARQTYQRARTQGRTAALLEQERPNLFRQSVANIRPGESVRVVVRFAETVAWRDGRYELAMPLSTGSRYTPGQGGSTPERPPGDVSLRARVDLGVALDDVESPTHPVTVTRANDRAEVTLAEGRALPDRDFVLRYRPRVAQVSPALLARRDGDDGFFTLTLHPDVAAPDADLTPRELVFVVDTSSSMQGAPLEQAKAVILRALDGLRATDTFRVVRFSDAAAELATSPLAVNPANLARARAFVTSLRAAGATEMLPGVRAALDGTAPDGRLRVAVLVTDGYVGNERDVLAALTQSLGAARVFAFGVGAAVNRYLLEQVAELGRGEATVVLPREDPSAAAARFVARIERPYLTDVTLDWGGLDVREVYPRAVPDVFAGQPVTLTGRYARGGDAVLRVLGRVRGRPWSKELRVHLPERAADHEALPSVWARARVHDLSRAMLLGETPALRDEVTRLGMRFGLVTDFTSLVAVDDAQTSAASRTVTAVPAAHANDFPALGSGSGSGSMMRFRDLAVASPSAGWGRGYASPVRVAPAARFDDIAVSSSPSPDTDQDTMRRHTAEVRVLFERRLAQEPGFHGRVVVHLTLDDRGQVTGVSFTENSLDAAFTDALRVLVRNWRFSPDGGARTVVVPINLVPG